MLRLLLLVLRLLLLLLEKVQVFEELEEAVQSECVLIVDRVVSVDLLDALVIGQNLPRKIPLQLLLYYLFAVARADF